MFERLSNSFALARSSWQVLMADKKLALFPVVSAVTAFLVLLSFAVPIGALAAGGKVEVVDANNQPALWTYPVLFAYYFCSYFVIVFCNSALVSCALMRFNGQEPTLGDGFRAAFARLPQIAAWSLVSASVGLLLRVIENVHEKVGEIVSAVLGTAWTVVTFFVVPVLVVEKVGPFAAIKRSLQILRKTWGEALIGNLGLGLFNFLLFLPGLLIVIGGVALAVMVQPWALGVGVALVGVVCLLIAGAVSSALGTIYLSALYQFAAYGQVPSGFDRRIMEHAFEPKKAA